MILSDNFASEFEAALQSQIDERQLPIIDIRAKYDERDERITIEARCNDDPLLRPLPSAAASADPGQFRRIMVCVVPMDSEETDRRVWSATMTNAVDAKHANYFPLPTGEAEVRVHCNWEYDAESLEPGVCELRDGDRLHYLSVRPPEWLNQFVAACATTVRLLNGGVSDESDALIDLVLGCCPADWPGQEWVELDNVGDAGAWVDQHVVGAGIDVLTEGEIADDEPLAKSLVEDYLYAIQEHGHDMPWWHGDDPSDPDWIAEVWEDIRKEFVAFLRAWRERVQQRMDEERRPM